MIISDRGPPGPVRPEFCRSDKFMVAFSSDTVYNDYVY